MFCREQDTVEKLQGTVQTLQEKLQATELKLQSFQNLSKMRETMIAQLNEEMHRKEVEYTNHINQLNREIENKIQEIKEKNKEIEEKVHCQLHDYLLRTMAADEVGTGASKRVFAR